MRSCRRPFVTCYSPNILTVISHMSDGAAFDKNDALYLKDEADKARHDELERRDAELAQFARVRSKLDSSSAMEPFDPGPAIKRPKFAKYGTRSSAQNAYFIPQLGRPGASPTLRAVWIRWMIRQSLLKALSRRQLSKLVSL